MNLELERPLIIFDIEATGTDVCLDRILTLAALKLQPEDFFTDAGEVRQQWTVNPGYPIPPASTKVHGITDAMVKDCPPLKTVASQIVGFFADCDLCGYNLINFDIPILWEELKRAGYTWNLDGANVVDASEIFRRKEPRTLAGALKKYCGREHDGAHEAMADVLATRDVLLGQRAAYPDLGAMGVTALAQFSTAEEFDGRPAKRLDLAGYVIEDTDGIARYTLKKVRGVAVRDDPGFGGWMLRNSFPENTKAVLRTILK